MAAALLRFAVGAFCLAGVCCGLPTSKPVPGNSSEESAMQAGSQGYVIVAGGYNGEFLASCFAYDINSGNWSALPDLPSGRAGGELVTHQGMVYYVAGWADTGGLNNVLMLSTKQNEWIEGPPLRTIAGEGVNALSLNDSLYALGGLTNNLERISSCGQGQFVWNKMASTLQTHYFSGAAVLNGKIYVCGAKGDSRFTDSLRKFCESYDPSANQFKSVKPMNEGKVGLSMVALNGYLYVIGGTGAENERYDPTNDQWTFFSHVPSQIFLQSAATDGERIYVVGGTDYVSNQMSMYVPELDIWQSQTAYPIDTYQASATFVKTLP